MDGGMRTVVNADLAHGYERVVIVAPVAAGIGFRPMAVCLMPDIRRAELRAG